MQLVCYGQQDILKTDDVGFSSIRVNDIFTKKDSRWTASKGQSELKEAAVIFTKWCLSNNSIFGLLLFSVRLP